MTTAVEKQLIKGHQKEDKKTAKQLSAWVEKLNFLDITAFGLPSTTAKTDPLYDEKTEYLYQIQEVHDVFSRAIPNPEAVFFGEFQGSGVIQREKKHDIRHTPPGETYRIQCHCLLTPNPKATERHIEQIAMAIAQRQVRQSETHHSLIEIDPQSLFHPYKRTIHFQGWTLYLRPDVKSIGFTLEPEERPEFSQHWIERHQEKLAQEVAPDVLSALAKRHTDQNFYLKELKGIQALQSNFSEQKNVIEVLLRLGYQQYTDAEILQTIDHMHASYCQYYGILERKDVPILRIQTHTSPLRGKDYIEIIPLLTPDQQKEIKNHFYELFQQTAYRRIHEILENQPTNGMYDLSPDSIVGDILDLLSQTLENHDRSVEGNTLSYHVVNALIELFAAQEHPMLKDIAHHLMTLVAMHQTEKQHPQDSVNFGWRPETMKLLIPASALKKHLPSDPIV